MTETPMAILLGKKTQLKAGTDVLPKEPVEKMKNKGGRPRKADALTGAERTRRWRERNAKSKP